MNSVERYCLSVLCLSGLGMGLSVCVCMYVSILLLGISIVIKEFTWNGLFVIVNMNIMWIIRKKKVQRTFP